MIPQARQEYNHQFTVERYHDFLRWIGERYNFVPAFKVCETPIFVGKELKAKLFEACENITDFLVLPTSRPTPSRLWSLNLRCPMSRTILSFSRWILGFAEMKTEIFIRI